MSDRTASWAAISGVAALISALFAGASFWLAYESKRSADEALSIHVKRDPEAIYNPMDFMYKNEHLCYVDTLWTVEITNVSNSTATFVDSVSFNSILPDGVSLPFNEDEYKKQSFIDAFPMHLDAGERKSFPVSSSIRISCDRFGSLPKETIKIPFESYIVQLEKSKKDLFDNDVTPLSDANYMAKKNLSIQEPGLSATATSRRGITFSGKGFWYNQRESEENLGE